MPPAVKLLNYMSIGEQCHTLPNWDFSRGFLYFTICHYFRAVMDGGGGGGIFPSSREDGMIEPKKSGCGQCTGTHARPKPTSYSRLRLSTLVFLSVCWPWETLIYASCCISSRSNNLPADEREGLEKEGRGGGTGEGGCAGINFCLNLT